MSQQQGSAIVMPTTGGEVNAGQAAAITKMQGGGLVLSPFPLNGGRRTRRISKKVLKMMKKMSKAKLAKLMRGGDETAVTGETVTPTEGGRYTRKAKGRGRKGGKGKSRKHGLLY